MPNITAIIGKIGAGKTTHAQTLPGVLLSVDDFMLPLFGQECELIRKNRRLVEDYLIALARQMLEKNIDVVFDWGFWTREDRARLNDTGLPVQWHYVCIDEQQRSGQIARRNAEIEQGLRAYYVHEGLAQRCKQAFEEPEEIDGLIRV
ncbi:MAG: ATP-binding protein [Oscillospiraceae bacterium]|nr:ATP-binding protein [Oscillospiraceae bacterium]